MTAIFCNRARWFTANILPLEPQFRAWLRHVTPDSLEVDDVVQDAFTKIYGLQEGMQIEFPKAYLYQIAKHLIFHHIRRSAVISIDAMAEATDVSVVEGGFTPERIVSGRQELERLHQAIACLPGECRVVFMMHKFDDLTQKTIAAKLCISENAVEKRMSRARRMIGEYLQTREMAHP